MDIEMNEVVEVEVREVSNEFLVFGLRQNMHFERVCR